MFKYTLKRVLTFIPMLIAISLLSFVISINAPGDPVERLSKAAGNEGSAEQQSGASKKIKQELRKKLGLDLPIFYLAISDIATSDTLYKIQDKYHKANLEHLTHMSGNWQVVSDYYNELLKIQEIHRTLKSKDIFESTSDISLNEINEITNQVGFDIGSLLETSDQELVDLKFNTISNYLENYSFLSPINTSFQIVKQLNLEILNSSMKWKTYIPSINWYGANNQYHLWLFGNGNDRQGLIRGDFGISYIDSQPISTKIWQKIGISFSLSLISIFLAYLISIPIGIYSAYKKDSAADKGLSLILFILYSMPSFFVGTLLLLQFANPDNLSWFPVSGIQDPTIFDPEWGFWTKIKHRMPYLILPIITYTYGSFAFLSRIMRVGMIDIVSQDYIRTARAKGLGEGKVILKHALRNSLLPVITVFAAIFPMAIGGSIIIEVIFSIPGMGVEIYNSILNYDYPMIITVFTLSGFLTMIGYLVADLLYAVVDPRISYK
ncbi:MAG: ABC transporter permease [Flavobacteriales bacterium]|jgi:peptide/nickel transport system permease protein|nr:ABC transporter permease [Flavobacteriales bacterium]|tara:strand:- start:7451 stop:8929 length:1479 start_codon:yes stop_codon:yes gene_type:complete